MNFKQAAVFYNAHKTPVRPLAEEACAFLRQNGVRARLLTDLSGLADEPADLLVSMGGDGTMLHCARAAAPLNIPIFGINCGTLGFLAACEQNDCQNSLQALLEGKCAVNERLMLHTRVLTPDAKDRDFLAFNDCVLRAAAPRAFLIEAAWSGSEMPSYFGDGVIVSTPTGSTAYSLAAGGPIVQPGVDVLVVTPICPHTLNQRPLILSAEGSLTLTPSFKNEADRAIASIDGQINLTLPPGARVQITRSPVKAKLLCPPERGFFPILNRKLKWGNR
ncbi:NAD(+)/NADH kinase [Candidatus Avelusimicrobium alvi]|uniref:NAD(+)/NADH kinase n=1 Tax=Candidatus Avelusimicrobium alvi TaxID=3416221 RepID=UPI003D0F6D2B